MESSCVGRHTSIAIVWMESELGSLNVRAIADFEQRLIDIIDGESTGLLIDCVETTYIGCGLLTSLLRCHQRARSLNRSMVFCSIGPMAGEVFAITRLDSLWVVFESRQDALDTMQAALHPVAPIDMTVPHA